MYEHFFRLKEGPFGTTPDPAFFYLSAKHQAALDHLVYGVRYRRGFLLITGDVGTGKTTLCRRLLDQLPDNTSTALVLNPLFSDQRQLLRAIMKDFEVPYGSAASASEEIEALNQFLLERSRADGNAVVIIDEGQHLSNDSLEMVRLLSNLETEKKKLLQIILVGQPELRDRLQEPVLRPLNQRLTVKFHLLPLDRNETREYIYFRLKKAGSQGEIEFFEPALDLIFTYTEGYPRRINLLCERVLLAAYSRESFIIDRGIVEDAMRDLEGDQPEQKIHLPRPRRASWTIHAKKAARKGLRYAGVGAAGTAFLAAGFMAGGFFEKVDLRSLTSQLLGATIETASAPEGSADPDRSEAAGATPSADAAATPKSAERAGWSATPSAFAKSERVTLSSGRIMSEYLRLWGVALTPPMVEALDRVDVQGLAQLEPVQAAGLSYLELPFSADIARKIGYPCLMNLKADGVAGDRLALLRSVEDNGFRVLDPVYGERLVDENSLVQTSQDVMIYLWRDYYEGQDFKKDTSGPWVARLQKDLVDLGYYRGVITGYYGTLTDQALREFQRQHALPDHGGPDVVVRMLIAKELGEEVPSL
ncbi:MAG: AAA family ATPase [Nitrospirae bacterium]|nr:AAA family ATPase [Nitrospirota bacterium]